MITSRTTSVTSVRSFITFLCHYITLKQDFKAKKIQNDSYSFENLLFKRNKSKTTVTIIHLCALSPYNCGPRKHFCILMRPVGSFSFIMRLSNRFEPAFVGYTVVYVHKLETVSKSSLNCENLVATMKKFEQRS